MRTIIRHVLCGIASIVVTAGLVAAAAPATAAVPADTNRAVVRVGDLDLASAAGRATAGRRIRFAANRVCGNAADKIEEARCRDEALSGATRALAAVRIAER